MRSFSWDELFRAAQFVKSGFVAEGRFRVGSFGLLLRHDGRLGEGAHEEDELPALVFGHAILERRHGSFALADLVEDLAVGDGAHALGVSEVGRSRLVHHGLGAVASAGFAMAFGAFVQIEFPGGLESGFGGRKRILADLGFFRDNPFFFLLIGGVNEGDTNEQER